MEKSENDGRANSSHMKNECDLIRNIEVTNITRMLRAFFFIIYHTHKNRIKREAMRKAGEPTGNNRDIAIKAGNI